MSKKIVPTNDKGKGAGAPARTEKDADDLVHSMEDINPALKPGEDPDDAVHDPSKIKDTPNDLSDPDDLVHQQGDQHDEDGH